MAAVAALVDLVHCHRQEVESLADLGYQEDCLEKADLVETAAQVSTNLTDLVRAADAALYDAKHQGRDCCVVR